MYKLGNILMFIAMTTILIVGGGSITGIISTKSAVIAPATVLSLVIFGAGASLKKLKEKRN